MTMDATQLSLSTILIGDRDWILPAVLVAVIGVVLTLWINRTRLARFQSGPWLRICGWLLLAACLVNPLWSSSRPRRGANVLVVLADVSRSHLVSSNGSEHTRAQEFVELLEEGEELEPNGWLNQLSQDFELKRYVVSDRMRQVRRFGAPEFDGVASNLQTALQQIGQRFDGQPLAGIVLLSDGNATDVDASKEMVARLPPIYPVMPPAGIDVPDVAVNSVVVTQSAFDDAPVTLQVQASTSGDTDNMVQFTLLDQNGVSLETQTRSSSDDQPVRFRHRPDVGGTVFYQVKAALVNSDGSEVRDEATVVNNQRLVSVDRGSRPRRILYVAGRPNWDFKFLRRAVETDPRIEMVGLIRIARKEAKFDYRGREGESSNSIFRGFDQSEQEIVEEYDEPVLVWLGTKDDEALDTGFPEAPEDLFGYDAIILDDVEAGFFLADQQNLIYDFVSRRGGGFMMMGGQESFRQGEFDRTPIGKLLPVDLSRSAAVPDQPVRMTLTRDGWLQPWVRVRSDETAEAERLGAMPGFVTLNSTAFVRPGAVVMAEVEDSQQNHWPALVVQRFGRGRTAALCIGDFWRWRLREGLNSLRDGPGQLSGHDSRSEIVAPGDDANDDLSDHARACRQLIRWLVADVPQRLDVTVERVNELGVGAMKVKAKVKGRDFEPRENVDVRITVTDPDGQTVELTGEPSDDEPGLFEAVVSAPSAGAWRAQVVATVIGEDDDKPLTAETGWASQPDQEEMQSVRVNRDWLESIAKQSGGRTVEIADIDDLRDELNTSDVPVVEFWSWPIWHQWWVLATAVGCFVADWTLRRRRGLP
jgi:uncharacterized membrane protein